MNRGINSRLAALERRRADRPRRPEPPPSPTTRAARLAEHCRRILRGVAQLQCRDLVQGGGWFDPRTRELDTFQPFDDLGDDDFLDLFDRYVAALKGGPEPLPETEAAGFPAPQALMQYLFEVADQLDRGHSIGCRSSFYPRHAQQPERAEC